jgi:dTDP-glucose pyrophosphorylase
MINVLIPACGKSKFFEDNYYPKNVTEINGKPMIEWVIDNYRSLKDVKFTVCLFRDECDKFHTDKIVSIVTNDNCNVVKQENMTAGALCTSLLAVDYIGNDKELIISNSDQILDIDLSDVVNSFRKNNVDCGVICFNSVHPRWSYIRVNDQNEVVETAEKHPLSNHAIAGFYYFSHGNDFIEAAKQVIRKRETYNDHFFISSTINEVILNNKKVGYYEISPDKYHSFYSPERIAEYQKGGRS